MRNTDRTRAAAASIAMLIPSRSFAPNPRTPGETLMTINWFPGHMNRARRELAEALGQIDVVIELLDARLPRSSSNPMLGELRGDKPVLTLLNKADLADPEVTQAWLTALETQSHRTARAVDATLRASVKGVPGSCRALVPGRQGPGRRVRCMVVGIPNVGKSTLINTLLGRGIAKVGDRPAVTRHAQRFELDDRVSLSDTPGVLWPKLEDQEGAHRLAASGAVGEAAFDTLEVATFAAGFLAHRYPEALSERYRIDTLPEEPLEILEAVGRRRGFLQSGGRVDLERAANTLLRELRGGTIGRISFDRPDEDGDGEVTD